MIAQPSIESEAEQSRLGFVIYPTHRRLKARNVVKFTRRLQANWADYCAKQISFAKFDASVQGWITHVRYADTWGLCDHLLGKGWCVLCKMQPKYTESSSAVKN